MYNRKAEDTILEYLIDRICKTKPIDILTNKEMKRLIKIKNNKK